MRRISFGVIAAVCGVLALALAISLASILHASSSPSSLALLQENESAAGNGGRYAVVLVLDGARPDYLHLVPMPHLQSLMRNGITYRNAIVGQELANTPPSHATIGTGMLPKHHGVEGFLWEDPRTSQVANPTETGAVLHGDLERVISGHRVPTLSGQVKRAYPGARTASVSAHKCYAADAMGTASTDYILCALIYHNRWVAQAVGNHTPPPGALNNPAWDVPIPSRTAGFGPAVQQWRVGTENDWTMRYARWAAKRAHFPRVLMINLSESDVLGHFAPNDSVIKLLMRRFDADLGRLITIYERAGIFSRTDFVITADHGMSRISSVVPYSDFTQAMSQAGATPVYVEHDTAAAIGIKENSKSRAVALNLFRLAGRDVDATYYRIHAGGRWQYRLAASKPGLSPDVLHAYVTLANTAAAASGPDIFAVFPPGVSSRSFLAYGYPWRAGHLGPQWPDQHIPLIISGPGVRRGRDSSYPARLVDVAPTVEHLLGAPTGKVDGIVLSDALQSPTSETEAAQKTRGAFLTPVVAAIRHRAGA